MCDANDKHNKLVEECKRIEEHALYTAETHFTIAQKLNKRNKIIKYGPVIVSFFSQVFLGLAILYGWDKVYQILSFVVSIVSTSVSFFNLLNDTDKSIREHEFAGKLFTALKHEARSLYQTFSPYIDEQTFLRNVQVLIEKYKLLIKVTPITDNKSYEEARRRIKAGIHEPD